MNEEQIKSFVEDRGIQTVRVEYADFHGVLRGKALPVKKFLHAVKDGIQFALPLFALDLAGNVAQGTGVAEELEYPDMEARPDLGTIAPIPWEKHTARVMADLYFNGAPLSLAPRQILRRVIEEYREIGLVPVTASELEFYLCRQVNGRLVRYVDKPSMVYTVNSMSDPADFISRLRAVMAEMNLEILASNHEFFASQYEINLKHFDALKEADDTVAFKQAVKEMACREEMLATFMARPFNDVGGSGYHLHVSLRDAQSGQNLFYDPGSPGGLSKLARNFIAGQLKHAQSLSSLLAPTVNSYKRYQLFSFAPYYVVWGMDNRSTLIRVPAERGEATRVENRQADAAANPYLVMASVLAAGLDGIKNELDPGEPFAGDAYQIANPEAYPVIPSSLRIALDELEKSEFALRFLGPEFIKAFLAVKRLECKRFFDFVTDWELNEYSFFL